MKCQILFMEKNITNLSAEFARTVLKVKTTEAKILSPLLPLHVLQH